MAAIGCDKRIGMSDPSEGFGINATGKVTATYTAEATNTHFADAVMSTMCGA
jgi:hypothetical protein